MQLLFTTSLLLITAGLTAQAFHATRGTPQVGDDIVTIAKRTPSLATLVKALQAAGLDGALAGDGPFTVFAPTDAAFAALPKATLASLLEPKNKAQLEAILTFHVVSGKLPASKVAAATSLTTLQGKNLRIRADDDGVRIGDAKVVQADVAASNGVIHVIDRVLTPPPADIVDTAVQAGSFKTLAKALEAAGLTEALRGDGPFTVFAPNDAAFAKLDPATLASLLEPQNRAKLAAILKVHVVSGKVLAQDVKHGGTAKTLQGGELQFAVEKGKVTVNGANVLATDVLAGKGVIHVIDSVLLPR